MLVRPARARDSWGGISRIPRYVAAPEHRKKRSNTPITWPYSKSATSTHCKRGMSVCLTLGSFQKCRAQGRCVEGCHPLDTPSPASTFVNAERRWSLSAPSQQYSAQRESHPCHSGDGNSKQCARCGIAKLDLVFACGQRKQRHASRVDR